MKRGAIALCAGLMLMGLLPGVAVARPGIDQENTTCIVGTGDDNPLAQTFTPSRPASSHRSTSC